MLLDEEELVLEVLVEVLLEDVADVLSDEAGLREAEDCLVAVGLVLLDTETMPVPVEAVEDEVWRLETEDVALPEVEVTLRVVEDVPFLLELLLIELPRELEAVPLVAPVEDAMLLVDDEIPLPLPTDVVELLANPPAVPLEPK